MHQIRCNLGGYEGQLHPENATLVRMLLANSFEPINKLVTVWHQNSFGSKLAAKSSPGSDFCSVDVWQNKSLNVCQPLMDRQTWKKCCERFKHLLWCLKRLCALKRLQESLSRTHQHQIPYGPLQMVGKPEGNPCRPPFAFEAKSSSHQRLKAAGPCGSFSHSEIIRNKRLYIFTQIFPISCLNEMCLHIFCTELAAW